MQRQSQKCEKMCLLRKTTVEIYNTAQQRRKSASLFDSCDYFLELEKQRRYTPHWGWAASVTWGMCCRCSYAS